MCEYMSNVWSRILKLFWCFYIRKNVIINIINGKRDEELFPHGKLNNFLRKDKCVSISANNFFDFWFLFLVPPRIYTVLLKRIE